MKLSDERKKSRNTNYEITTLKKTPSELELHNGFKRARGLALTSPMRRLAPLAPKIRTRLLIPCLLTIRGGWRRRWRRGRCGSRAPAPCRRRGKGRRWGWCWSRPWTRWWRGRCGIRVDLADCQIASLAHLSLVDVVAIILSSLHVASKEFGNQEVQPLSLEGFHVVAVLQIHEDLRTASAHPVMRIEVIRVSVIVVVLRVQCPGGEHRGHAHQTGRCTTPVRNYHRSHVDAILAAVLSNARCSSRTHGVTPDTNSTPVCVLEDRVHRLAILLGVLQCEQHVVVLLGATATTRERNNDDEPCIHSSSPSILLLVPWSRYPPRPCA